LNVFKNGTSLDPMPRQGARIAFGLVLIAGVSRVVSLAHVPNSVIADGIAIAFTIGWSWLIALGAACATYAFLRLLPWRPSERRLLHASCVVPTIGIALILPISLHLLWRLITGGRLAEWGDWVALSLMFTGFAHVVFASLAAIRASQVVRGKRALSSWVIYGWCVAAANCPLPFIPAFYVAVTGLLVVPLLWLMKPVIERELAIYSDLPTALAQPR
jgi:hypothetical protein